MAQFLVMLTELSELYIYPPFYLPHVSRVAARVRDRLVDVRCRNIVLLRLKQRSQRYDFCTDSPVLVKAAREQACLLKGTASSVALRKMHWEKDKRDKTRLLNENCFISKATKK